jgi:hypothetical protein
MFAISNARGPLTRATLGMALALAAIGAIGFGSGIAGAAPQQPLHVDDPVPVPAPAGLPAGGVGAPSTPITSTWSGKRTRDCRVPTTAAARCAASSRRAGPSAHNTIGGPPCGRAAAPAPPAPPNAANASSGHSSPSGVISRPPRRASSSRSSAARSITRVASVCRARSSLTRPRRTRSAASSGPTQCTSAASSAQGGSATRDR